MEEYSSSPTLDEGRSVTTRLTPSVFCSSSFRKRTASLTVSPVFLEATTFRERFPSPALNVKKMSYAASCYGMDFLNSTDAHKGSIKSVLDAFDFIGVRDTATEDFVKWSGCTATAHHTCDPTVFLDVNDLPVDENTIKEKLKKRGFDFFKNFKYSL